MNRIPKIAWFAVLGLLVLALAIGAGAGLRLQAQAAPPETEPDGNSSAPAATGAQGSAPVAEVLPNVQGSAPPDAAPRTARLAASEVEPDAAAAYLRIPGTMLKPRASTVEWAAGGDGGCIYASSGSQYMWFNTALYLPQDSVVTMMRFYVDDTSASNSTAYFTVYDLWGNIVSEWGASSSGSGGQQLYDVVIPDQVIDYSVYSYVLNWQPGVLGSEMQLCGFRIFYTPPPFLGAFLPATMKNAP